MIPIRAVIEASLEIDGLVVKQSSLEEQVTAKEAALLQEQRLLKVSPKCCGVRVFDPTDRSP
jgi:hypothetical protein